MIPTAVSDFTWERSSSQPKTAPVLCGRNQEAFVTQMQAFIARVLLKFEFAEAAAVAAFDTCRGEMKRFPVYSHVPWFASTAALMPFHLFMAWVKNWDSSPLISTLKKSFAKHPVSLSLSLSLSVYLVCICIWFSDANIDFEWYKAEGFSPFTSSIL